MTEQILIDACAKARNGEIHLGTANGWDKETNELYASLNECILYKSCKVVFK